MLLDKITPIDLHLAKKLRQFRLSYGMSQDKLGELIGVTFQQIQKYEKAKNRISASRLFEIAQILERPIADFFSDLTSDRSYYNYDFKSEKNQKREVEEFEKEALPLIRAFREIECPQARKHLIALASSISAPKKKKVKHGYS